MESTSESTSLKREKQSLYEKFDEADYQTNCGSEVSKLELDLLHGEMLKQEKCLEIQAQIFEWFQKMNIVAGNPQEIVNDYEENNRRLILSQGRDQQPLTLEKVPSLLQRRRNKLFSQGH